MQVHVNIVIEAEAAAVGAEQDECSRRDRSLAQLT
jgi:hypothetical protein